jgi:hypothetical protein
LDGLVSLLPGTQQPIAAVSTNPVTGSFAATISWDRLSHAEPSPVSAPLTSNTPLTQPSSRLDTIQDPTLPSSIHNATASPDDLLIAFRDQMATHIPFVVIPEGTAQSLQEARPFLFSNITMAASYRSPWRQTLMRKEIMKNLSDQVLIEGKKTLDLLQGLLVLISWYVLFDFWFLLFEFGCRS